MLALSLSDKFCCFDIFVFVFVFNRFLFSRFSFVLVFIIFFVLVLVFVNENHTGVCVCVRLVCQDATNIHFISKPAVNTASYPFIRISLINYACKWDCRRAVFTGRELLRCMGAEEGMRRWMNHVIISTYRKLPDLSPCSAGLHSSRITGVIFLLRLLVTVARQPTHVSYRTAFAHTWLSLFIRYELNTLLKTECFC